MENESGSAETSAPRDFYEALAGRPLTAREKQEIEESDFNNIVVNNLEEALQRVNSFANLQVLGEKIKVLDGWMVVIRDPWGSEVILREDRSGY